MNCRTAGLSLVLLVAWSTVPAMDLHKEIDLEGDWKIEIGDDFRFKDPDFDDSSWETIDVPDEWEDEGFPGYDGYAWYRSHVRIPAKLAGRELYLRLGRIDDVDETYFNGILIGKKGSFPPNFETAWDEKRIYRIPREVIRFDQDNVIAVRVYDAGGKGGIVDDPVGIYSRVDMLKLALDLSGPWKFRPGDDERWAQPDYDDSRWVTVKVPCYWEKQGFPEHDGVAWYRRRVFIPADLARSKLILLLGYINDIDQTYFNGQMIGHTGRFPTREKPPRYKSLKHRERAYFIPPFLIRPGAENVIAVRVLDVGKYGGIYRGYVGIATREEYLLYSKRKKHD